MIAHGSSFSYLIWSTGLPVLQIFACEESNRHSGALVFLLGQLISSIPFLFLISISSSLVFYFLVGLQDGFSLLMYFVLNFFVCLLVNEGLMLLITSLWQHVFWSVLTMVFIHVSFIISTLCYYLWIVLLSLSQWMRNMFMLHTCTYNYFCCWC